MIFYRKNFGAGVLDVALKAAPDYTGDPGYDEIAVVDGHTLPSSSEVDLTDQFTLVIWSDTANPGDDPNMEIVTATKTSHPRIYQVVERGAEDTDIVAHPVGSYVGLHYTAGVSNADLEPILDILEASKGSLIYAWQDIFGNSYIEILPPGSYGQVLVTGGLTNRPFWDWVWLTPGASGGFMVVREYEVFEGVIGNVITIDHEWDEVTPDILVLTDIDSSVAENEVLHSTETEVLVFDGSSGSESYVDAPSTSGKFETLVTHTP